MADSELVKNVMFPAVQLEKNATVGEALQKLQGKNAFYAIVVDLNGKPFAIVTKERLSASKGNVPVQMLSSSIPHPVFIEPNIPLESIARIYSNDFRSNRNLMGIAVREHGEVQGILLGDTIEKFLSMGRIAGTPRLLYRCRQCPGNPICSGDTYYPPECPEDPNRPMEPADE